MASTREFAVHLTADFAPGRQISVERKMIFTAIKLINLWLFSDLKAWKEGGDHPAWKNGANRYKKIINWKRLVNTRFKNNLIRKTKIFFIFILACKHWIIFTLSKIANQ